MAGEGEDEEGEAGARVVEAAGTEHGEARPETAEGGAGRGKARAGERARRPAGAEATALCAGAGGAMRAGRAQSGLSGTPRRVAAEMPCGGRGLVRSGGDFVRRHGGGILGFWTAGFRGEASIYR